LRGSVLDLKEESILGDAISDHWYYVSKGRALIAALPNVGFESVLDIGAGSGVFSKLMLRQDVCRQAVCVDTGYEYDRDTVYCDKPLLMRQRVVDSDSLLVLMIDVLEHVEDDLALLDEYVRLSPPDTLFLIAVPAFQFLWSGHDEFLGHYRRYTRASTIRTMQSAGLQVLRCRYFFGLLFPVAAFSRILDRVCRWIVNRPATSALRPTPARLNRVLIWLHEIERRLLYPVNTVAGLSVICLARKP
jgi:hypothetical protein